LSYKVRVSIPGALLHLASEDVPVAVLDSRGQLKDVRANWLDDNSADTIVHIDWKQVAGITYRLSEDSKRGSDNADVIVNSDEEYIADDLRILKEQLGVNLTAWQALMEGPRTYTRSRIERYKHKGLVEVREIKRGRYVESCHYLTREGRQELEDQERSPFE
jgi:hypothetical protein